MSMRNMYDSYSTQETDILGNCLTKYEVVSNSWQGIQIRKQKDIRTCGKRQQAIVSFFPRSFFNEESSIRNIPIFADNYGCDYTIKNGIIKSSKCVERNAFVPLAFTSTAPTVETISNIVFQQEINGLSVQAPIYSVRHNLLYAPAPEEKKEDASQTTTILRAMCSEMTDEIKQTVPEKFEELVASVRQLSYESASRIYQSVQQKQLCQSQKLEDIWNNALIMAASEASIRLVAENVLQKESSPVKATYLSMMLAFANQPTAGAVKSAVELLEKQKHHRQLVLGVSALIHNYCNDKKNDCKQNQHVQRALSVLKERLHQCKPQNEEQENEIIVALKAIRNIGQTGEAQNTLLECAVQTSNKNHIRAAAVEALSSDSCNEQVHQKLMNLLKNDKSTEVRIIAYRVITKCPKTETVRQIIEMLQKEESKQVGSYIVSHMKNVKQSSNPMNAKYRDILMKESNIPENRFPQNFQKYSKNYELSHFFEQWGFGGIFRTDVIFEDEAIPTSIRSKLTLPMYEKHMEIIEIGLRQKGLQRNLQSMWEKQSFGKSFPEIMENVLKQAKEMLNARDREQQKSQIRRAFSFLSVNKEVAASMFVRVDGKDLFYISEKDIRILAQQDWKQLMQQVERYVKNWVNNPNTDRLFAMTPLDTKLQLPSSNGMHIELQWKQTVVVAAKIHDGNVIPSAAIKTEGAIKFGANSPQNGYKWVGQMYSAPKVQFKLDTNNGHVLLVTMPQDEIVMAHWKSSVKAIENNQEKQLQNTPQIRQMSGCTKTLSKVTGIELCSKMDIPSKLLNIENWITAPWNLKYTLKKNDREMKGWEFTFGVPSGSERDVLNYKIGFNTPRSRINREMSAKLQVSAQRDGKRGLQMKLKSPWKSVEVSTDYKWQSNEVMLKSLVMVDQSKKLNFELQVQQQWSNKKYELRPRMLIQVNDKEQVNIKGTINYDNGRKKQLQIDIKSANSKQVVKGSFVLDGSVNSNMKMSVDCEANIANNPMRVFGTVDMSQNTLTNDLRINYQFKNQKQEIKITSKFQNLGTKNLKKMNSFIEITSTQFPEKNFHMNWNHINKPFEHFENEIVVMYSNHFQDANKKISLLQVSKINKQQGRKSSSSEHVLNVFLGPMNRDYELQAKTNIETGDLPKYKIEVSGREKKQNKNFKSSFEFLWMSRNPLKVSIDAQMQTSEWNLRYSDKLEESGRNNYNGNCKLQYNKKQVNINYSFKVKVDQNGKSHQFDFDIKLPNSRHSTQHQGLLRMSPKEFELRSKLNHRGNPVWECQSLYNRNGKSKLYIDTPIFTGKAEGNPYAYNTLSTVEFTGKTIPLKHSSDYQFQPNSLTLNTKTSYNGKQVMLNSHLSGAASKIVLDTQPLNAKLDWNSVSYPMSGNFEIRSKNLPTYHKSSIVCHPEKWELKSNTQYNRQSLADVDAVYSRNAKSLFNIKTPHFTGNSEAILYGQQKNIKLQVRGVKNPYLHNSELTIAPKSIEIISTTQHKNVPLYSVKSLLSRNAQSNIDWQSKNIVAKIIADPRPNTKNAVIKIEHIPSQLNHVSELQYGPKQLVFTSNSEHRGQKLFTLNSQLSRVDQSKMKISTRPYDLSLELQPFASSRSAKLLVKGNNNQVSHVSEVTYQPNRLTTIVSKTQTLSGNVHEVDAKLSQYDNSHLKYSSNALNAFLSVNPHSTVRQAQLDLTRHIGTPLYHSTKLTYEPLKHIICLSKTDLNNKKVIHVDSKFSHIEPSFIKLHSQPYDANFEVNPHSYEPSAQLVIKGRQIPIVHSTKVTIQPRQSLTVVSNTEKSGKPWFALNSMLSRVGQSHVSVNTVPYNVALKVHPYASTKQFTFDLNRPQNQFVHNTQISLVPRSSFVIKSNTQHVGRNLLNIDSVLSRNQRSHLNIEHPLFNTECSLNPYAKSGQLKFKLPHYTLDHDTNWNVHQPNNWELNTNTRYGNQNLFKLNSKLNPQGCNLNIDYLARHSNNRRILMAASAEYPKNTVAIDMSFDADKNPQNKLSLKISADKQYGSDSTIQVDGNFRGHHIDCPLKMGSDLLRGPHDLSCQLRSDNANYQLILRHSVNDGKVQCTVKMNKDGKQLLDVENLINYQKTSNTLEVSESLKIQSSSKSLDGFEFGAQYNHELSYGSSQITASANAKLPAEQPYSVNFKFNQQQNSFSLNTVCETPIYDFKRQEITLNCNIDSNNGKISGLITTSSGKKIEIDGNFKFDRKEASASLKTSSDFESVVPRMSFEASLKDDQEKTALLNAEVNSEKWVEVLGTLNFRSLNDFDGQAVLDSKWSPRLAVKSRGNSDSSNTDYEVDVKKDAETLLIANFKGGKTRGGFQYKGMMDVSGSNVAQLEMNSDYSPAGPSYSASYKGLYRPVNINYKATQSNSETKHTAKLCSPQCVQLQWIASDKSTRSRKEQYLSISLQDQKSASEYQFEYNFNSDQKSLLNKMELNWNTAKYGYVIEMNEDRQESHLVAQLTTPQRKIEMNGKSQYLGETTKTTIQFFPYAVRDRSNKFEVEWTHRHIVTRSNRQWSSTLKISHNEWAQPILGKIDYQWQDNAARPMELKFLLDCGKGSDKKILLDAQIENNDNNPRNKSLTINLYDGNRRNLDAYVSVHLANLRDKMSTGVNWHWVNRQRQMKKGSHIVVITPQQQSFTVSSHAPSHQVTADGKWQSNDNRVSIEANVKVNGENRNAHASIETKNNLCAEVQWMREPADLLRKYHFCINADKLMSEASHKAEWIQSTFNRNYWNPLQNKMSTEFYKLQQDIYDQTRPMMKAWRRVRDNLPYMSDALEPLNNAWNRMYSTVSYYTNKASEKMMKQATRTFAAMCAGNNNCYSVVYAYERSGLNGAAEEFARITQQYRRDAHQIIYKIKGNVKKMIDSLPSNYAEQVSQAINSFYDKVSQWQLTNKLSNMMSNAIDTWNELASRTWEQMWQSVESMAQILRQNEDMNSLLNTIQEIVRDVKNELRNVNWDNMSSLFGKMTQFLLSPKHWLFDSRFTNYNLEAGEVTLVISSPAELRLRSKWMHA
ncbi:apolipophorins-like protein [Leptotrombidium deliense]|uniref:Apolipophorins-like protein n=1 Tax=Leptotrombidium deliense TaxID=299467 RepID=A0A443ST66_9ACAR|nr:apolipophorins-like protein [Leptotrombidium deliense]